MRSDCPYVPAIVGRTIENLQSLEWRMSAKRLETHGKIWLATGAETSALSTRKQEEGIVVETEISACTPSVASATLTIPKSSPASVCETVMPHLSSSARSKTERNNACSSRRLCAMWKRW